MRNLRKYMSSAGLESLNQFAVKVFTVGNVSQESLRSELAECIHSPVGFFGTLGMETQQEDEAKENGNMNVYVVNPRETGFAATAALTADALRNPDNTVVAFVEQEGEPFSEEEKGQIGEVRELFEEYGTRVFDNMTQMSEYVNRAVAGEEPEEDGSPGEGGEEEVDRGNEEVDGDDETPSDSEEEEGGEEESGDEEGDEPSGDEDEDTGSDDGGEDDTGGDEGGDDDLDDLDAGDDAGDDTGGEEGGDDSGSDDEGGESVADKRKREREEKKEEKEREREEKEKEKEEKDKEREEKNKDEDKDEE